jgi:hypothetical protein
MQNASDEGELKTILQEFEICVAEGMQDWQVPGMAIAIIRGDEVIYSRASA